MGQQHFEALVEGEAPRGACTVRADVWSALVKDCARREAEAASREQVLRELLDHAHARIRSSEAALERLGDAVVRPVPDDSGSPREESAG